MTNEVRWGPSDGSLDSSAVLRAPGPSPPAYRSRPRNSLGLEGGLQEQAHAEAGDLLKDAAELVLGGEELIDLGPDARHAQC